MCTIHDIWRRRLGKQPRNGRKIFSLYSNFKELMKINEAETTIQCINGIKVLSCILIIIGHRRDLIKDLFPKVYENNVTFGSDHILRYLDSYKRAVDTFFACSGILVTQSLLRCYEK